MAELKRLRELERAHAILREEHALLKSHPVLRRTKAELFAFIDRHRTEHRVSTICRLYGVTRAGYSAWRHRAPSARAKADHTLQQRIAHIHRHSHGTYGSPRIHRVLQSGGARVGKKRVARLMRAAGLQGRVVKVSCRAPACIFHSERGTECGAYRYRAILTEHGIRPSMNRPRRAQDNAPRESFFHTMKIEWIRGRTFAELDAALSACIRFYNHRRLHSGIDYHTPEEHERLVP